MNTHYHVITDTYHDSVQLMRIASDVAESMPITDAQAVMGTPANRQTLLDTDHLSSADLEDVDADDLLLVASAPDAADAEAAVKAMRTSLTERESPESGTNRGHRPQSIRRAVADASDTELALVSVPGEYATLVAWNALHEGLHVQIFSDNVPLADERELKQYAYEHDRLLMGPDCGSALVDGFELGFVNKVADGTIGLVSASGTGLQAVTSRISRRGGGISHAIGTGGRDLREPIAGLTTRMAIDHLDADEQTSVIVLVSKPPDDAVFDALGETLESCSTPTVTMLQGVNAERTSEQLGCPAVETLQAAADRALQMAGVDTRPTGPTVDESAFDDAVEAADADSRFVRGLFTGGTLCTEAALELEGSLSSVGSNVGVGDAVSPSEPLSGHVLIDFGADEFTETRPHPMIDPTIRTEALERSLRDESVGVVLLDVVLGYGAHDDPAAEIASAITNGDEETVMIASVCGTDGDPQNRHAQIDKLTRAGVFVAESNVAAARLARQAAAGLATGRSGRTSR